MKIAVTGDIHASNWKEFSKDIKVLWSKNLKRYILYTSKKPNSKVTIMNDRLYNSLSALCDIRDISIDNGVTTVLILGDVFHTRGAVDTQVFNSVYRVLESFYDEGLETYILAGNHDQVDSSIIPENSIDTFKHIANIINTPEIIELEKDTYFYAVPYSKDKEYILSYLESFFKHVESHKDSVGILGCHLGVTGGLTGSGTFIMKDTWNLEELHTELFKYCFLGHYHKPQYFDRTTMYVGSPLQNTFNDEGLLHGFVIADTEKKWDISFIPLKNYPKFITLTDKNINKYSKEYLMRNYCRIKTTSEKVEAIATKLEGLEDKNIKINIEKEYTSDSNLNISMSTEDILKTYIEDTEKDEEKRKYLLELGKAIIARVNEEG